MFESRRWLMTDDDSIYLINYGVEEFVDVQDEMLRQRDQWGEQHHNNGTEDRFRLLADRMRALNDKKIAEGDDLSWAEIMSEEYYETMAIENNDQHLLVELNQLAAVCLTWIKDIKGRTDDRRVAQEIPEGPEKESEAGSEASA